MKVEGRHLCAPRPPHPPARAQVSEVGVVGRLHENACQEGTRDSPSPFDTTSERGRGRAGGQGKAGLEMRRASTRVHQAQWLWP